MFRIILSLFITGLLFGSGPCLASCGPFLVAYVAATKKDIRANIMTYILFSLSRISAYLALSLAIFFFSRFMIERLLGNFSRYLVILGGGMMVLIGIFLSLGKRLELPFWQPLYRNMLERDRKSILILGLIIGLMPCLPLLAIFSYIGLVSRTWFSSLLYTFSFGLGTFISPLILLVILAGLIPRLLANTKVAYSSIFSFICGLVVIFLGLNLIIRAF